MLTRQLRELWVVGALRKPGEGEEAAEATIESEVSRLIQLLNSRQQKSREAMMGSHGTYVSIELEPPKLDGPGPELHPQPPPQQRPAASGS